MAVPFRSYYEDIPYGLSLNSTQLQLSGPKETLNYAGTSQEYQS